MSAVLDIDNLLESPLADLHALAGELELEGYRTMRKPDLTIAILESRGAVADEIRPAVEAKATELATIKAEREAKLAAEEERAEAEREAAAAERAASRESGQRSSGRQRGGRGRGRGGSDRSGSGRGGSERSGSQRGGERQARQRGGAEKTSKAQGGESRRGGRRGGGEGREQEQEQVPTTPIRGVFEPGSGGGGRLRTDIARRVRADGDVPRGEVRRWNLKRGDLIEGEAKKARRGRTDFVVASITSVNGQSLEQRKQKTPSFEDLAAAGVGQRYAKRLFKHAPVCAGSRTVVTGPTRAAATEMLFSLAREVAGSGVVTTVVVVAPRPEDEAPSTEAFEVLVAKPGKPVEDIVPALELVLERDRRLAESGRETAVLVDGLDLLDADKASEIFMAAKNLTEAGALTVACSAGAGSALEAQATSIGYVSGGRKLKLDKKASWSR